MEKEGKGRLVSYAAYVSCPTSKGWWAYRAQLKHKISRDEVLLKTAYIAFYALSAEIPMRKETSSSSKKAEAVNAASDAQNDSGAAATASKKKNVFATSSANDSTEIPIGKEASSSKPEAANSAANDF